MSCRWTDLICSTNAVIGATFEVRCVIVHCILGHIRVLRITLEFLFASKTFLSFGLILIEFTLLLSLSVFLFLLDDRGTFLFLHLLSVSLKLISGLVTSK